MSDIHDVNVRVEKSKDGSTFVVQLPGARRSGRVKKRPSFYGIYQSSQKVKIAPPLVNPEYFIPPIANNVHAIQVKNKKNTPKPNTMKSSGSNGGVNTKSSQNKSSQNGVNTNKSSQNGVNTNKSSQNGVNTNKRSQNGVNTIKSFRSGNRPAKNKKKTPPMYSKGFSKVSTSTVNPIFHHGNRVHWKCQFCKYENSLCAKDNGQLISQEISRHLMFCHHTSICRLKTPAKKIKHKTESNSMFYWSNFIQILLLLWLCQSTAAISGEQFEIKCRPIFQVTELQDTIDNLGSVRPFLKALTFPQQNILFVHGQPVVVVNQQIVAERSVSDYSKVMSEICFRSALLTYEPDPRDLLILSRVLQQVDISEFVMIGVVVGGEMTYRSSKKYSFFSALAPAHSREQQIYAIATNVKGLTSRLIPDKIDFTNYKVSFCTDSTVGTLTQMITLYKNIQLFSTEYGSVIDSSIVQIKDLINQTRTDIENQKDNCRPSYLEADISFPSLLTLENVFKNMDDQFPDLSHTITSDSSGLEEAQLEFQSLQEYMAVLPNKLFNLKELYELPGPDGSLIDANFWEDLADGQLGEILLLIVILGALCLVIGTLCYCKKIGVIAFFICCCQMFLSPMSLLPHILNRARAQNRILVPNNDLQMMQMRGRALNQECQNLQIRREERRNRLLQLI